VMKAFLAASCITVFLPKGELKLEQGKESRLSRDSLLL
jgi:hypothetical protein